MRSAKRIDLGYDSHIFFYLILFMAANAVLAYGPGGLEVKLWVFLAGLLLPFVLAAQGISSGTKVKKEIYLQESFSAPGKGLWIGLVFLALAVRLAQTSVPGYWPVPDDGRNAAYAIELTRHWSWDLFISPTQVPPLFHWSLALFFKFVSPSLFSMWLFPAICSILVFTLSCVLARTLFSRSFSFLLGSLMAFGFWPLYAGKFCNCMAFYVLWELLTFIALAALLKKGVSRDNSRDAWVLGFCVAAGFWVGIPWPVVAAAVALAVFGMTWRRGKERKKILVQFLVLVVISAALFAYFSIHERNGAHIQRLFLFSGDVDWKRQLQDSFSNFSVLLWGCDLQNSYGPVWGGVLNPVLGAFFLAGILECFRSWKNSFVRWVVLALLLFLLPGAVTRNFDLFRNIQALPLLILITAMGVQGILLAAKTRGSKQILLLALLFSAGLDLRHLWLTYHPSAPGAGSNYQRSAYSRAFDILREKNRLSGPGLVLFDLRPNEGDQTLSVATYRFNAARDPKLSVAEAKWMAVIVNINYKSFLVERFPGGEWHSLFLKDQAETGAEDKWMLGIIPLDAGLRETAARWAAADQEFRDLVWSAFNIPENRGRKDIFERLPAVHRAAQGDRLLASLYWEMVYSFHRWENLYGEKETRVHYPAARQAIQYALREGYPTAYFYNELGGFLAIEKDYVGAREAFRRAVNSKVNNTPAADNLEKLSGAR